MKNLSKTLIIAILFTTVNYIANAQNDIKEISYAAYLKSSTTLWEKAIHVHKNNIGSTPDSKQKFDLAMLQYGLLNATMSTKDEATFDKYLDGTKELLQEVIEENKEWGDPSAVYSSILGLEMAYSPMKGMYLGYKSSSYMEDARKLSPESPLVIKLFAGSKLYTPEMFGGDSEVAKENFVKAVDSYENSGESLDQNWLYMDALAHLGISYKKVGENDKAEATFQKALKIEPDFYWVSKSLLPSLSSAE